MSNQIARILKVIKDDIWVEFDQQIIKAAIRGILRTQNVKPTVGDWVEFSTDSNQIVIEKIIPRKNSLERPNVNNVDIVVLVQSTIEPAFNTLLLDKMIAYYEMLNCHVVIAVTKSDKNMPQEVQKFIDDYNFMGYESFNINDSNQYNKMLVLFKDKIVCFVGNSGVGKSTLINRINPDLNIKTQEISMALNRGKHTTTNTTLIKCKNFYLVDTPGYSSIELKVSQHRLARYFFTQTLNNEYCRFDDCFHYASNHGCLVQKLLIEKKITNWRYANYLEIVQNLKEKFDK